MRGTTAVWATGERGRVATDRQVGRVREIRCPISPIPGWYRAIRCRISLCIGPRDPARPAGRRTAHANPTFIEVPLSVPDDPTRTSATDHLECGQVFTIAMDAVVGADPAAVWRTWRPTFPMRPPEEQARNLNLYDLAYGLRVPVTLVAVNEMRNWTVEHALPRGKLVIDHWMAPLADGGVRVGKRYEVQGPMSIVYRLFLARAIRRSIPEAFAALAREVNGPQ